MLFDSHCHLSLIPGIKDLTVIKRAITNGVTFILDVSVGLNDFITRCEFKVRAEGNTGIKVYLSAGIPPYFSDRWLPIDIDLLKNQITGGNIVAIGEIGLDYFHMYGTRDSQIALFDVQLELSRRFSLPVVIHNRNSDEDLLSILKNYRGNIRGIIHCFSSDIDNLREFLDLGFFISFAGNITYRKNNYLREALLFVPDDRLLIETDSPYLPPEGFRGKPNEPARLKDIAAYISKLKNQSLEELAYTTTRNAKQVLKIIE